MSAAEQSARHRADAFVAQLVPGSAAGSDDSDPFSVAALRKEAAKQRYGAVTPNVLAELVAAVGKPSEQIAVHDKALQASAAALIKTAKLQERTLKRCSTDRSHFEAIPAAVVVAAASTAEVSAVLKVCYSHRIPVNPSGTRTGLEGGSLPLLPGVVLDVSSMGKVLRLSKDELLVEVQPGVEKMQLNNWLKKEGYFFAVDPGSNACVGGYASTGASGTLSAKYGTMRENCRSMTVVLADGRVMTTRTRAAKTSVGYNIHQLLMGSEGTLCVVTELVLKILPLPPAVLAARARFPTARAVSECVAQLVACAVSQMARAELLNTEAMHCINKYEKTAYAECPTLFLEFHGTTAAEVRAASAQTAGIAKATGCTVYESTDVPAEIDKMWTARRNVLFASFKMREGHPRPLSCFVTDVCVPIHLLPEAIAATEEDFRTMSKLPCPIAGHVADGNFHCLVPYDASDPAEVKEITTLNDRMVRRALAVGGTASGEHGVGLGKMKFLVEERGPVAVDVMRRIKQVLDPRAIMNPYKVITPLLCEH